MTEADLEYVKRILAKNVIGQSVLEIGSNYEGPTCRGLLKDSGRTYYSADMDEGPGVDFVVDFENPRNLELLKPVAPFGSVLVLNVLEHTFNPIQVLDTALSVLKADGTLVVIAPAAWPVHNFPIDCYRFLPDWYLRYAATRNLNTEYFEYVGYGPVVDFQGKTGEYHLPPPWRNQWQYWYSRVVHRFFNTYGRSARFPSHLVVGVVLTRK
jgi:SAM-dependent methyltransferase